MRFIEAPNIVKAADTLHISQPLLSKHLRIMEEAFPQPLFYFEGRKKQPTRYGLALYETLTAGFAGLDDRLKELNNNYVDPAGAHVRIGGREELLTELAPRLKFRGRIDFLAMSGDQVGEALRTKKIEIGLTQHRIESDVLIRKPYMKDSHQLVIPKTLKVADGPVNKTMALELRKYPYLSYGPSDQVRNFFAHFGMRAPNRIGRTLPHWPTVRNMCAEGHGWSLIPILYLKDLPRALRAIPVSESILASSEFHLFYPRDLIKLTWFKELVSQIGTS